jgi:hypothetical protein
MAKQILLLKDYISECESVLKKYGNIPVVRPDLDGEAELYYYKYAEHSYTVNATVTEGSKLYNNPDEYPDTPGSNPVFVILGME